MVSLACKILYAPPLRHLGNNESGFREKVITKADGFLQDLSLGLQWIVRVLATLNVKHIRTQIKKTVYYQNTACFSNTLSNHTTVLYNGGYPGHWNIQNRHALRLFNVAIVRIIRMCWNFPSARTPQFAVQKPLQGYNCVAIWESS